jgi:hypothetical protein
MIKGIALYLLVNSAIYFGFMLFGNFPIQFLQFLTSASGFLIFFGTGLYLVFQSDWIAERVLKTSADPVGINLEFSRQWVSLGLVLLGCMAAVRFLWGIQAVISRFYYVTFSSQEDIAVMSMRVLRFDSVLNLAFDLACAVFLLFYSKPLAKKLYSIHADIQEEELA